MKKFNKQLLLVSILLLIGTCVFAQNKYMHIYKEDAVVNVLETSQIDSIKFENFALKVGDYYQGGIIAYLDETGLHGLIAAPEDQSDYIKWWDDWDYYGVVNTAIGTGRDNTVIVTHLTTVYKGSVGQLSSDEDYAAQLCNDLVLNGYDDWFLPSKDELNELYKNKDLIGGFSDEWYWSSSEDPDAGPDTWSQNFGTGAQAGGYMATADWSVPGKYGCRVRAVRAF